MTALSEILSGALVEAFGWTLLHSLWQGALIAIIMGVIMIFLRKASSRLHYLIYCMGLLLILGASTITFIKYFNSEPRIVVTNQAENIKEINPAFIIFTDALLNTTDESSLMQGWNSFSNYFSRNVPLLVSIWFLGMILFMLKFLGALAYTQRLKYYRTVDLSTSWKNKFDQLSRKTGIKKSVKFIESYAVKVPVVISYFKPVVIIPVGMLAQMPPDQVEAVISHELAHIYRRDYLINLLQSLIEIVFFYHPAVWWLSANIRAERENICDDMAVENCGDSIVYAKALASVQELKLNSNILAPAFSNKKNVLLNRIQRMMKTQRLLPNYTEGFISALIVFISIAAISASATITFNPEIANSLLDNFNVPAVTNTLQDWQDPIQPDTTKKTAKKMKITSKVEGKIVEIKSEEGIIKEVKVDGEEIPEEEFVNYEEFIADENIIVELDENLKLLQEKITYPGIDSNELRNVLFYNQQNNKYYKGRRPYPGYFISGEADSIFDNVRYVEYNDTIFGNFEFIHNDSMFNADSLIWYPGSYHKNYSTIFKHKYFPHAVIVDTDTKYDIALQEYVTNSEQYRDQAQFLIDYYNKPYYNTYPFDSKTDRIVKKELRKDGLLGTDESDCIIELDTKNMYVNGEKQAKSKYKKYRKLVESMIDEDLGNDFSYKLIL